MDEIMKLNEVAALLRIHPTTINRELKRGGMPFMFRVGSDWRAKRTDVEAWTQRDDCRTVAKSKGRKVRK